MNTQNKAEMREQLMQSIRRLRQENQELTRRCEENLVKLKMLARQVEELEKTQPPTASARTAH